jgi:DNA polymerase III alpha subunit
MPHADFVHLRVHSAYSLSEGAIPVKALVKLCKEQGMPAVAVTDSAAGVATYNMDLAKRMERVLRLEHGRIVEG